MATTRGSRRRTRPRARPTGRRTGRVALPRDSDLQALAGREVRIDPQGVGYEAGDVLCFADGRRISHVALWAGAGRIVHAALSRGGVASDDLFADIPTAKRLRDFLVVGKRVVGKGGSEGSRFFSP